jgi:hypothetical protein
MLLRSYLDSMFETNAHHIQCDAYGQEGTELRTTIFTSQSTNLCLQTRRQSVSLQLNICKFLDVETYLF